MEMSILADKVYCGDCLFLTLKRGKDGVVTSEHTCTQLGELRTEWQTCTAHFKDKRTIMKWHRERVEEIIKWVEGTLTTRELRELKQEFLGGK